VGGGAKLFIELGLTPGRRMRVPQAAGPVARVISRIGDEVRAGGTSFLIKQLPNACRSFSRDSLGGFPPWRDGLQPSLPALVNISWIPIYVDGSTHSSFVSNRFGDSCSRQALHAGGWLQLDNWPYFSSVGTSAALPAI
jgi:hypothetical protein